MPQAPGVIGKLGDSYTLLTLRNHTIDVFSDGAAMVMLVDSWIAVLVVGAPASDAPLVLFVWGCGRRPVCSDIPQADLRLCLSLHVVACRHQVGRNVVHSEWCPVVSGNALGYTKVYVNTNTT